MFTFPITNTYIWPNTVTCTCIYDFTANQMTRSAPRSLIRADRPLFPRKS